MCGSFRQTCTEHAETLVAGSGKADVFSSVFSWSPGFFESGFSASAAFAYVICVRGVQCSWSGS